MKKIKKAPVMPRLTRIKEAQEVLRNRAEELLNEYFAVIQDARAAQEFETAAKHIQWLIEHMPSEEGETDRIVAPSVDKQPKQVERSNGPQINIGFAIGGLKKKELPQVTVDRIPPAEAAKAVIGEVGEPEDE
jgi:hypothetical protein